MNKFAVSLVIALCSASMLTAQVPTKTYTNTVSALNNSVSDSFEIQNNDHIAVLQTVPATTIQMFKAGSGRVSASKRHSKVLWQETEDLAASHKAQSPLIKAGEGSWVICDGRFANEQTVGRGKRQRQVPTSYTDKNWQSRLVAPGAHIVIVNIYNTEKDISCEPGDKPFNEAVMGSAKALASQLSDDGSNAVHLGVCGMNVAGEKMLPRISNLQTFIENEEIEMETVSTFSTLGHGGALYLKGDDGKPEDADNVLWYATAERDKSDPVGNAAFANGVASVSTITNVINPYFNGDVNCVVNLDHCFTASPKATFTLKEDGEDVEYSFNQSKTLVRQFKDQLPFVTITGHNGTAYFKSYKSGGEDVFVPPVTGDGGTWVVLQ